MPALAWRQWRSLHKAVRSLPDFPDDAALHLVRIKAKRLRYIAEVTTPVLKVRADRRAAGLMAKEATALQDVLGEVHDSAVNQQWLRDVATQSTKVTGRAKVATVLATALAAGQLVTNVRANGQANREAWDGVWERLRKKQLRKWARPNRGP
jgi:CHAD domain-containing protein